MYTTVNRGTGFEVAANAGLMASSMGKATVTPAARRKLRRSNEIFFKNIAYSPYDSSSLLPAPVNYP
jgi:hypothetical protein